MRRRRLRLYAEGPYQTWALDKLRALIDGGLFYKAALKRISKELSLKPNQLQAWATWSELRRLEGED